MLKNTRKTQSYRVTYGNRVMECWETGEQAAKEQAIVHFRLQNVPGVRKKLVVEKIRRVT